MASMLQRGDPEETVSCPYNTAHQIIRGRLQTHLVKCSKENPDKILLDCPYNKVHRLKYSEYVHHVDTCTDRVKIDSFMYVRETENRNKFPIVNQVVDSEESWDDVNVQPYDPTVYCENSRVLRQLNVKSAAKRRDFRFQERQRMQQLTSAASTVPRVERELASEFAKRAAKSTGTVEVLDEDAIYHTTSLLQRVQLGDEHLANQQAIRKASAVKSEILAQTENEMAEFREEVENRAEASKTFSRGAIKKRKGGIGRGRFVSS